MAKIASKIQICIFHHNLIKSKQYYPGRKRFVCMAAAELHATTDIHILDIKPHVNDRGVKIIKATLICKLISSSLFIFMDREFGLSGSCADTDC